MFEVKLTIEPHEDGVHCGECEWLEQDTHPSCWCGLFYCSVDGVMDGVRCRQCIDQEKQRQVCGTCKHWNGQRCCLNARPDGDRTDWVTEYSAEGIETGPDFGCIHWTAKQATIGVYS